MEINKINGFTLIETLVVLGVSAILMVAVGSVMTSSYRAKNSSDMAETVQNEAQSTLSTLKNNVLDADSDNISCPLSVGTSLSFITKSGGFTTLLCDSVTGNIASVSAESGWFNLIGNGVVAQNCDNFVVCTLNESQKVATVDFNLDIGMTGGTAGSQFWKFVSKVAIR